MDDIDYMVSVNILDIRAAQYALEDRQYLVVEELLHDMMIPYWEQQENDTEEE